MRRRWLSLLVVVVAACSSGSKAGPPQLAGTVGKGGGVVAADGTELRSTPKELYVAQAEGEVVVVPFEHGYWLGAVRRDDRICLRIHPVGAPSPAEDCSAKAPVDHGAVKATSHVVVRTVAGKRVAIGFTHLAASTVEVQDHEVALTTTPSQPWWMTRFFVVPVAGGDVEVRILDGGGHELETVRAKG